MKEMSLRRRRGAATLAIAWVGVGALLLFYVSACETENTEATIVPDGGDFKLDSSGQPPNNNDGSANSPDGDPSSSPEASTPDGGFGLACATDVDCKGGKCFSGVCICDLFFRVQANGTCGSAAEPLCVDQADAGARCNSPQPVCREIDAGEIAGSNEANRSCGDFAPAVCCFAGCKGPNFLCCGQSATVSPQICTQGWRTCRPNERAVAKASDCN
jgi:hypothetical protein